LQLQFGHGDKAMLRSLLAQMLAKRAEAMRSRP
jgi:hypothetical protein